MDLPSPKPAMAPDVAPFWVGTSEASLVIPRCRDCDLLIWYPRSICPSCGSHDLEWRKLSGEGSIYSLTVVRRGFGAFVDAAPYILAYVELDEGPRVLTNVVDHGDEVPAIGSRVKAHFVPVEEAALLRFRPVPA